MTDEASTDLLLLYDFLQTRGGAERVLSALQAHLQAPVCVGYVDQALFDEAWMAEQLTALVRSWQHPTWDSLRVLAAFATRGPCIASRYQTRLYSGSYAVLAHTAGHGGRSAYYCHTPPRFLYDLRDQYQREYPFWQRPLLAALRAWLQPRYEAAVRDMDIVMANSENVRGRLARFVGVESQVIYPPVDVEQFRWVAEGDYFLSTARLEPLKRVDRLVQAFKRMPTQRLVVSSGGSELTRLRALAANASNIHFTGWLDDLQLARLMGEARASIYVPVDEDFGMSPVESMAAGKPVIGVAEGGLLETVVSGETGVLLPPGFDLDELCAAIGAMDADRARSMRSACEWRAQRFSRARFLRDIDHVLAR